MFKVKREPNILIPTRDGTKIAGYLYLPDTKGLYMHTRRFPAIIDYKPYRKDDWIRIASDERYMLYLAERGYACILLDVRGTGSSEGANDRMFGVEEQQDGYDAVEWVAKQDWCDGKVAMTGVSYGAITSYLVAGLKPPSLKTIVPIYGLNKMYRHNYEGGNMGAYKRFGHYGPQMHGMNSFPPYPDSEGRWLDIWKYRLENNYPWALSICENQVENSYWTNSSVEPEELHVPIFIIGGWRDISTKTPDFFPDIHAPKKLLMGPWVHIVPDMVRPGPKIDYLHEMVRWFDYWMKDIDNGIMDEPQIAMYTQTYDIPDPNRDNISGEWRSEAEWPLKRAEKKNYYLHPKGKLNQKIPVSNESDHDFFDYNPSVGTMSMFVKAGSGLSIPMDQRLDEALSLNYTTDTLTRSLEITGTGKVKLHVSSTAKIVSLVARISDVAPDGASNMITRGVLNVTHRDSDSSPSYITPGRIYEITVELDSTSYLVKKGHKLRLSLSGADLPQSWPTPYNATNTIYRNKIYPSTLILPVVKGKSGLPKPKFKPPPQIPPIPASKIISGVWNIQKELSRTSSPRTSVVYSSGIGINTDVNTNIEFDNYMKISTSDADPSDVFVDGKSDRIYTSPIGKVEISTRHFTQSTVDSFHFTAKLDVFLNDQKFFKKTWVKTIPRNYC